VAAVSAVAANASTAEVDAAEDEAAEVVAPEDEAAEVAAADEVPGKLNSSGTELSPPPSPSPPPPPSSTKMFLRSPTVRRFSSVEWLLCSVSSVAWNVLE
jgi:hypothetical protein